MTLTESFINELTREAETTRRVLERVPEDKLTWRPHPKSMSLGHLAKHIAMLPAAITELVSEKTREVPNVPPQETASRAELLAALDRSVEAAVAKLKGWGDAELAEPWTLTRNGTTVIELPRAGMLRTVLLNHWYHHRGQLTVYLRLLDVPLPGIYGPTADDPRMPIED